MLNCRIVLLCQKRLLTLPCLQKAIFREENSIKGFTYRIILAAADGPELQVFRIFLVFFFFVHFLSAIAGYRTWLRRPLLWSHTASCYFVTYSLYPQQPCADDVYALSWSPFEAMMSTKCFTLTRSRSLVRSFTTPTSNPAEEAYMEKTISKSSWYKTPKGFKKHDVWGSLDEALVNKILVCVISVK